jgi:hypothetical protein
MKGEVMNIIARVKEILLTPKAAWSVIATEQTDTATLYTQYVMLLAAIPAVCGFIGMSVFGVSGFGVSMRVPLMSGLVQMVVGYGLALAMVFVLSLIADVLAPNFGGQKNPMNALKLVAYSSTASMVGGVFTLIPALGLLSLVASLYSLYLLYLGVPTLMKVPEEKSLVYTIVLVVCAIIVGAIIGTILGAMRGGPTMGMHAPSPVSIETPKGSFKIEPSASGGSVKIETPTGAVTVDVDKAQAWGKRMEEASNKMQAAQQSGDQSAMDQAMKDMTALQAENPMMKPK